MKYFPGQVVQLLDTEYKPAGTAVICNYEQSSRRYEVDFTYPNKQQSDKITVPEERLIPANEGSFAQRH